MKCSAPLILLALILILPVALPADDRLEVVVSIPPQQWLVQQIGGDRVDVEVLVAPGESPATYTPTDAQVTRLMQAHIYFRMRVPFERGLWFDAIREMGRFILVDLQHGIEVQADDPHTWLVPRLLAMQAATVAGQLSQIDPNRAPMYESNLERLQFRLQLLDEEIHESLEPYRSSKFFVFHPSWGYFAKAYGLQQVAIESGGREPSDRELTALRIAADEAGVTTVFVQPQIHSRSAQAFAESIGARLEILDPLAADVIENLAETTAKLVASFGRASVDEP